MKIRKFPRRAVIAAVAAVPVISSNTFAADVFKANNATNLDQTTSWTGGVLPTSADVAVWDATVTAANTVLLGSDQSYLGLRIANPTGAVTISAGNTLTLGTSGLDLSLATQNLTIASGLSLLGDQAWSINAGRTLTISGLTNGTGNVTTSGAGNLVLSNNLSFTGGFNFTGTGVTTLTGANTYTGATNISAGTVRFGSAGSIGGSGASVTLSGTGIVVADYAMDQGFLNRFASAGAGVVALGASSSNALDLNTPGLANVSLGAMGTVTYSGALTPAGTTYRLGGGTGTLFFPNAISGANNLVVGPTGSTSTVIFSNNQTHSGGTSIDGGTLELRNGGMVPLSGVTLNGGSLVFARSDTTTFTAPIPGTGGIGVRNGGLTLDFSSMGTPTDIVSPTSTLLLSGGNFKILGNAAGTTSQTFAGTTVTGGVTTVTVDSSTGTDTNLALGAITRNNTTHIGSGVVFVPPAAGFITTTNPISTLLGGNNNSYGLVTDAAGNPVDIAAVNASGQIVGGKVALTNAAAAGGWASNPTTGNLSLNTSEYVFDNTAGNTNTIGSNGTIGSLLFNTFVTGGRTVNVNNAGRVFTLGRIVVTNTTGASNVTVGVTGTVRVNSELIIDQYNTDGVLTVNPNGMNHTGTGGHLTKNGPGTMIMGSNLNASYGGQTFLNGGVTQISNNAAFTGNASNINLNGGTILANAIFNLDNGAGNLHPVVLSYKGGGLAATTGNALTITGVVSGTPGTGPLVIGIPGSAANGNTVGLVPGTGGITANPTAVNAAGTVILNNTANTYTGGTVIASGVLQLNSTNLNVLGTGGVTVNGGTFKWGSANTTDITTRTVSVGPVGGTLDTNGQNITLANPIQGSGSGALSVRTGAGTLTLNGANTFTGGLTLAAGALKLGAANTYTGATSVNAGTLTLEPTASLGNTAITVATGATLAARPGAGNTAVGTTGASLTLNAGSNFTLVDGAIGTLTLNSVGGGAGNVLTLGGTNLSPSVLGFDLGSTGADQLIANNGVASLVGNQNNIALTTLGATAPGTLTGIPLIFVPNGGLNITNFALQTTAVSFGANSYAASLSVAGGNQLLLNLTLSQFEYYWTGGAANGSWNTIGNFATSNSGATAQTLLPSASNNIFLTANSASQFSQTLDGSYVVNSLNFTGTGTSAATNAITLANGSGTNTLTINGTNSFADSAGNPYAGGTGLVVQSGSAAHTISANLMLGNSQTWEINNAPANALTVTGNINDGGVGYGLTKSGPGTLILSGTANSFGSTSVSGGTLVSGAANAFSTGSLTVRGTGTADLAGNAQSVTLLSDGGVNTGTLTSSSGTPILTLTGNAVDGAYTGAINGSIALVKTGTNTQTLGGTSSYTGGTTVTAGRIVASSNSALGNNIAATSGLLLNPIDTTSASVLFTSSSPLIGSLANSDLGTASVQLGNTALAGSPTTLTVGGNNSSTTFSGVISDGTILNAAAVGSLVTTGSGTLTLSGANTFTGSTVVGGTSTLLLGNPLALRNSTLNYNNQGGTLSFGTQTASTVAALTGAQSLALTNADGVAVALTLGGNNASTTFSGNLSGLGSITKNGTGVLTLSNANYAGRTLVQNGGVTINGGTLTGQLDISGLNGASNVILDAATLNSTSTLFVTSATGGNTQGALATLILRNGATVTVPAFSFGSGGNRTPNNTAFTIQDAATSLTVNGTFNFFQTIGGGNAGTTTTNLNGGTLSLNAFAKSTNGANQTAAVRFNGTQVRALADSATFLPNPGATLVAHVDTGGAKIDSNGFNISILAGLVHGTGVTDGGLIKSGLGTLISSGTNTYNGITHVTGGTLQFGQQVSLYNNLTGSWTDTKIVVDSGTTLGFNVGGGGEFTESDVLALSALGTATGGYKSGSAILLDTTNAGGNFALNNPIVNPNAGANVLGLTKAGTGTLTLSATNTYTGPTTVRAGVLKLTNPGTLYSNTPANWTATNIIVNSGATLGLNVGGGGEFTAANVLTLSSLGTATGGFLSGSTILLDTTNASGNFTYGGGIPNPNGGANVLGVTKSGTGMLTLGGTSTYAGTTTVEDGVLTVTGTHNQNAPYSVINSGALAITSTGTVAASTLNSASSITNDGSLSASGGGTLNGITGTGTTAITGGTLITGSVAQSTLSVSAGAIADTSSLAITGALTNNGTLSTNGGGTIAGITGIGTTNVTGGALTSSLGIRQGTLSIANGSSVSVTNANPLIDGLATVVSSVNTLSIDGGSKIDLNKNDLVVDYGANGTVYADILTKVKDGLPILGFGGSGNGITSTDVQNQTQPGTMLGVIDGGATGGLVTTLSGFSVANPATSVLVKYTWRGDANLDGVVNGSDYALADTGFSGGGTGWFYGDMNYDDVINGSDYALIDTGFSSQTGPLPEPATLSLLGLGAMGMLRRRRRAV